KSEDKSSSLLFKVSACFAPKNIWQSPPNAHAYRLLIFKDLTQEPQPLDPLRRDQRSLVL
ncbi:MAG: hypothetical protein LBI76_00480, partial [Comamonas sp.]|nr:hypothetical protein [Comamonas sp.]